MDEKVKVKISKRHSDGPNTDDHGVAAIKTYMSHKLTVTK